MEFIKLQEVNEKLLKTDIKGKEYVEVNQRILAFRELYPNGAIITDLISLENGICTFKASVFDCAGQLKATGHAQEKEGSTFINKTSYIENCETSAVGRALGILGIGATNSIASAEEVLNAISNQEKKVTKKEVKADDPMLNKISYVQSNGLLQELELDRVKKIMEYYKVEKLGDLNMYQYQEIVAKIKKERGE